LEGRPGWKISVFQKLWRGYGPLKVAGREWSNYKSYGEGQRPISGRVIDYLRIVIHWTGPRQVWLTTITRSADLLGGGAYRWKYAKYRDGCAKVSIRGKDFMETMEASRAT